MKKQNNSSGYLGLSIAFLFIGFLVMSYSLYMEARMPEPDILLLILKGLVIHLISVTIGAIIGTMGR